VGRGERADHAVRVESARAAAPRLRHVLAVHASPADLVAQATPLLTAAARRGEVVATAVRPPVELALRNGLSAALGRPVEPVLLAAPDGRDGGSGQTAAARRARELRALVAGAPGVAVVAEHDERLDGRDGRFWTEFDAAVNVACAELPITLVCFFPELPLHREVVEGAPLNHPLRLERGELRPNPEHRDPRAVLAAHPGPVPQLLGPPDRRMPFRTWQLQAVRAAVAEAAEAAGCDTTRAEDVVLAVNEVATNAVEHGAGEGELALWVGAAGLVAEVHDRGRLADPLPGLRAPRPGEARGRGIWVARQLCDVLHVWHEPDGTHVRVRAAP
jgi:anti-sigma regulatory factor (Ser/Thr protein kinase)